MLRDESGLLIGYVDVADDVDLGGYVEHAQAARTREYRGSARRAFATRVHENDRRRLRPPGRFPDQYLRAAPPLGQPGPLDLTVPASGTVRSTCGMEMYAGTIVVR